MKLTRHDLTQLDDDYLESLKESPDKLLHLSKSLLHDLKESSDRLNQNSQNSSSPPSSDKPWDRVGEEHQPPIDTEESAQQEQNELDTKSADNDNPDKSEDSPKESGKQESLRESSGRKPGKQPGALGFGRSWKPSVTQMEYHKPSHCTACGSSLENAGEFRQYTAYDCVDIALGTLEHPGCTVAVTRHALFDAVCACGHTTREAPYREQASSLFSGVEISEWRLVGPQLASLIVHLKTRMRLSLPLIRELLVSQFGIPLSQGVVQKCIEEAGASADPLEDELVESVLSATELPVHVDETSWPQGSEKLWMWVFTTTLTVCYFIGGRTKGMFKNMLTGGFKGWLMTDGYSVYRDYEKRLRCWAHLYRKGKGLKGSTASHARCFGARVLELMDKLKSAVYRWRELNKLEQSTEEITKQYADELEDFKQLCEAFSWSEHEKTRKLAGEFIKDWEAIFKVLEHPYLPLTNNDAERSLRHWVISRRISYGTRSDTGSRVFALLASVIDTCRKRQADSLVYLAEVIRAARTGHPIPSLPTPKVVGV